MYLFIQITKTAYKNRKMPPPSLTTHVELRSCRFNLKIQKKEKGITNVLSTTICRENIIVVTWPQTGYPIFISRFGIHFKNKKNPVHT